MLFPSLREQSRLNRGILLAAPVFWSSFSVFLNPIFGFTGFTLHFLLCLPRKKTNGLLCIAVFFIFSFWFSERYSSLTLESIPFHRDLKIRDDLRFWTGKVEDFPNPSMEGGYSFLVNTSEGLYRAFLQNGTPPTFGSTILLLAREETPEMPANPGQRDPQSVLRAQGAMASLKVESWKELNPPSAWHGLLIRIRSQLEQSLERYVPHPVLPLVSAALLNDTRLVSADTQQDFIRSGMQHILAISGQHVGLLIAFLLLPALCLRLPRKIAFVAAAILTAVYIPVTGSPVSVARAGFMLAFLLPSIFLERPSSALNAFCLTMALDLILSPFHILNLGFQLSYAATLALLVLARPSRTVAEFFKRPTARLDIRGGMAQMIFLSFGVTMFIYPILAASTHAMAPWSVLGNLITIPISSAMLIAGLCTWTFSPFPLLAHAAGACTGLCSLLLESSVHFLAGLPEALWPIVQPSSIWIVFLFLSAFAIAFLFRDQQWRLGFLSTCILISLEIFRPCLSASFPDTARVTFLSIGHGDAAVLELPGATILIDDGPSPQVAQQIIIPFLQSRGIRRIDVLMLTHPDMDHYGGTFALLNRIPIGFILSPALPPSDAPWECLKNEVKESGIPWKQGGAGDLLYQKGKISLRILGPDSSMDSASSDNNHSLVCLLQTPREKVLFTGDIEGPAQQALANTWPLWRGAWLKSPHHGSDRTTLPCFLTAVNPPRVAISSGHRPGFPGLATMEQLEQLGAKTSVTARDGAIFWEFGRDSARVRNFKTMF